MMKMLLASIAIVLGLSSFAYGSGGCCVQSYTHQQQFVKVPVQQFLAVPQYSVGLLLNHGNFVHAAPQQQTDWRWQQQQQQQSWQWQQNQKFVQQQQKFYQQQQPVLQQNVQIEKQVVVKQQQQRLGLRERIQNLRRQEVQKVKTVEKTTVRQQQSSY